MALFKKKIGAVCADADIDHETERFVGGKIVGIKNIHFSSVCGASIKSPKHSLTAAHCFSEGLGGWTAMAGARAQSDYLARHGYIVQVTHFVIHDNYMALLHRNDIAVVALVPIKQPSESGGWRGDEESRSTPL